MSKSFVHPFILYFQSCLDRYSHKDIFPSSVKEKFSSVQQRRILKAPVKLPQICLTSTIKRNSERNRMQHLSSLRFSPSVAYPSIHHMDLDRRYSSLSRELPSATFPFCTKAFPGQSRDEASPTCPGSTLWSSPGWTCPKHFP